MTKTPQPPTDSNSKKFTIIIAVSVGGVVAVLAVGTVTLVLIVWFVKNSSKHGM